MKAYAVYGPPGCGKTTELMRLIGEFVDRGYPSESIGFLSHTRAAASEALSRLNMTRSDKVSTIHSQCYRLLGLSSTQLVDNKRLLEFSEAIGVPIKNGSVDSEEGIEVGDEYLAILNRARNRLVSPFDEYMESHRPGSFPQYEAFVQGYTEWKRANGFIDFTDMLERFLRRGPEIEYDARVMLVDEGQDLSPLQWEVIKILTRDVAHTIVAGDDDQAIYVWGGADPTGMVRFEEDFNAKRKILTQSHRIPASVHNIALGIIGQVSSRVPKEYLPRAEEGLVTRYGYTHSLDLVHGEDTLVLCRTGAQKKEVEKFLIEQKVPYLNDGGKPGLYQTKVARAIRVFNKLTRGESVTAQETEVLSQCGTADTKNAVRSGDFKSFLKKGHMRAIQIPNWHWDFYNTTNVDVAPTIRISSIHGSKGREADRVVLHTGMTSRTAEGMDSDPDAEHRVFYVGATRARHRLDILAGDNGYPL